MATCNMIDVYKPRKLFNTYVTIDDLIISHIPQNHEFTLFDLN